MTRILNLPVVDETTQETTVYNVEFVYDAAVNVYGSQPKLALPGDETILIALEAVTDALNAEDPIPPGASSPGR